MPLRIQERAGKRENEDDVPDQTRQKDVFPDEVQREAVVLKKLRLPDDKMFRGLKVYKPGEAVEPWPSQREDIVRGPRRDQTPAIEKSDSGVGTNVSPPDEPTTAVSEEVVELRKNPPRTEEIPGTRDAEPHQQEPSALDTDLQRLRDHRNPRQQPTILVPPKPRPVKQAEIGLLGKKLQEAFHKAQSSSSSSSSASSSSSSSSSKTPIQSNSINAPFRSDGDFVTAAKSDLRSAGAVLSGPLPEQILRSLQHSAAMVSREMGLTRSHPRPLILP